MVQKFQIDDAAISECKKKNKWECHCPGCNKYIDVKKYEFMFAYEFPGAENKKINLKGFLLWQVKTVLVMM